MLKLKRLENVLFFLTLLFLPTQLGKHFWPEFSFVYSLPVDYLSPTVYFWDILVVCLWIIFLLGKRHINRLALGLFYFFILTQSLSLFNSNIGVGLVRLQQYTVAGFFGVYIASLNKGGKDKLYLPLVLAILFESLLAITQFIKGGTIGFWILGERTFSISTPAIAKFDFYGREFLRPYATFPHPNVLAAFLLLGSLLIVESKIRIVKFITVFAMIMTFSRTAILAGIFATFFFLRKKALIVTALFLLLASPLLFTRFTSIFNYDHLTILRREELAKSSLELFFKSPFIGVGLNNFIPSLSAGLVSGPSRFLQPAHNIFLLELAETGIVGLLGLLVLIGYPIRQLGRNRKWLLIWGVVIFLGMFDHYFLTLPQGYRLLFLIWGLSLSVLEFKGEKLS